MNANWCSWARVSYHRFSLLLTMKWEQAQKQLHAVGPNPFLICCNVVFHTMSLCPCTLQLYIIWHLQVVHIVISLIFHVLAPWIIMVGFARWAKDCKIRVDKRGLEGKGETQLFTRRSKSDCMPINERNIMQSYLDGNISFKLRDILWLWNKKQNLSP